MSRGLHGTEIPSMGSWLRPIWRSPSEWCRWRGLVLGSIKRCPKTIDCKMPHSQKIRHKCRSTCTGVWPASQYNSFFRSFAWASIRRFQKFAFDTIAPYWIWASTVLYPMAATNKHSHTNMLWTFLSPIRKKSMANQNETQCGYTINNKCSSNFIQEIFSFTFNTKQK